MRRLAFIALAINPILWASFYGATKEALSRFDPILFSFFELSTMVPIGAGLVFFNRKRLGRKTIQSAMVLGGLLYLSVLASTLALRFTTATDTAFYPAMDGFFAAILASTLFRRKLPRGTWIAGFISMVGALLVIYQSFHGDAWVGDLVGIGAAILYTLYMFAVDENEISDQDRWIVLGIQILFMSLLSGLVSFSLGHWNRMEPVFPKDLLVISYVGLVTTLLPTAFSIIFQKYMNPVVVAFLYISEPVFSSVFATLYLGEIIQPVGYIGGALIVIAAIINTVAMANE